MFWLAETITNLVKENMAPGVKIHRMGFTGILRLQRDLKHPLKPEKTNI